MTSWLATISRDPRTWLQLLPAVFAEQLAGRAGLLGYGAGALLLAFLLVRGRSVPSSAG